MMEAQHICYTGGLEDVNKTWHSARLLKSTGSFFCPLARGLLFRGRFLFVGKEKGTD